MAADYLAALDGGWQMLGNDTVGDCAAVSWANNRRLVTAALTGTARYPDLAMVYSVYASQNPGFDPNGDPAVDGPGSPADGGMDLQTLLEYLTKTGGPDGVKAVGFAQVNPARTAEVKAAIALFGSLLTGITVLDVNEQEFAAGQPWSWDPSAQAAGGHAVLTGGYGPPGPGPLGGDERFVTWAAETSFDDSFWASAVEEAWVVIWPEMLGSLEFMQGVDMAQFASDYQVITGRPFPYVVPPSPAPVPGPSPAPAQGLLGELASLVRTDAQAAISWLDSHGL